MLFVWIISKRQHVLSQAWSDKYLSIQTLFEGLLIAKQRTFAIGSVLKHHYGMERNKASKQQRAVLIRIVFSMQLSPLYVLLLLGNGQDCYQAAIGATFRSRGYQTIPYRPSLRLYHERRGFPATQRAPKTQTRSCVVDIDRRARYLGLAPCQLFRLPPIPMGGPNLTMIAVKILICHFHELALRSDLAEIELVLQGADHQYFHSMLVGRVVLGRLLTLRLIQ